MRKFQLAALLLLTAAAARAGCISTTGPITLSKIRMGDPSYTWIGCVNTSIDLIANGFISTAAAISTSTPLGADLTGFLPNAHIGPQVVHSSNVAPGAIGSTQLAPDAVSTATVDGVWPVAQGGTGATTAAGAQANLSVPSITGAGAGGTWPINTSGNAASASTVAASGVQAGPLGSGVISSSAAVASIGAPQLAAHAVSTNTVDGVEQVTQGGTGATTAAGARSNLSAAQSGANNDITSESGGGVAVSFPSGVTGSSASFTLGITASSGTFTATGAGQASLVLSSGATIGSDIHVTGAVVATYLEGNGTLLTGVTGTLAAIATRQIFKSGSGTYTTPAGVRQLRIRMVGGGASGPGINTAGTLFAGTNGGISTFSVTVATGGVIATQSVNASYEIGGLGGTGGAGGSGVFASSSVFRSPGGAGDPVYSATSITSGNGGNSMFGGGGEAVGAAAAANGNPGIANTGGGGSGACAAVSNYCAAGGGAGEYVELTINSPAATYGYTVGAGGPVGVHSGTGADGGAGGSGIIIVDEFY